MSGKPNKTENDIIKHKNEYIERLRLESSINKKNYDANALYKSTGQVMPIVGLTDNRSIEEKLLDIENLKQNIAKSIGSISSLTFGTNVVQSLLNNPLNIDNNLIVFTSQRIPELITNLRKIYAIGIRGDKNDVQQIVNFIVKMYTDTNNFAKQAKDFININPSSSLTPAGGPNLDNFSNIKNTLNFILPFLGKYLDTFQDIFQDFGDDDRPQWMEELNDLERGVYEKSIQVGDIMRALALASPSRELIDFLVNFGKLTNRYNDNPEVIDISREILEKYSVMFPQPNSVQTFFDKNKKYLEILNDSIHIFDKHIQDVRRGLVGSYNMSMYDAYKISLEKGNEVFLKFLEILNPSGEFPNADSILLLVGEVRDFYNEFRDDGGDGGDGGGGGGDDGDDGDDGSQASYASIRSVNPVQNIINPVIQSNPSSSSSSMGDLARGLPALAMGQNVPVMGEYIRAIQQWIDSGRIGPQPQYPIPPSGNGFKKRRGRPRGSGVYKPYSQTVLENLDLTKGIEPSSKFIKFGKYLLNSHKLKKDNTFSLKHISGGNIIDIPSQRLTEDLSKVIKIIIGGGMPSYDELNKLSESEKSYLHKVCSKSNILDKVSIPTPSKDSEEKEIHNFEVMRGEIMSGNDSPELIKKFKLLIIKLQKNNSLPKKEVYEILEDLNSLGY